MNPGDLVGGRYRLTHRLGAGAMGAVWAAINERTGRKVALKLILHPIDDLRDRLRRETQACGGLEHRNIIDIYDVGETSSGDPFIVMQLLRGETLAALIKRRRRLPHVTVARIGRDIASALATAHEAQIVHRDLKPANIFLSREEGPCEQDAFVLKVLDFGVSKNLAKSDGRAAAPGMMVGSPAYMSPEQIRMARDVDPRADIWSLGIILFEMLAGERPFQGTAREIIRQVLVAPIPPVSSQAPDTPPALDAIVTRCLSRDRDRRYRDAKEIEQALDAYTTGLLSPMDQAPSPWRQPVTAASVSDAGVSMTASSGDATPTPPVRRRASWLYATAGAGVATIAALSAVVLTGRASPAVPATHPAKAPPTTSAPLAHPSASQGATPNCRKAP